MGIALHGMTSQDDDCKGLWQSKYSTYVLPYVTLQ